MSIEQDQDRRLRTFLDDGPTRLSDRTMRAVLTEVHRSRQRIGFQPWRIGVISRLSLALVVAVALLAAGEVGLWLTRPGDLGSIGGPSSPLPPSSVPSASLSPATAPATPVLPAADGPLTVGTTYLAESFSRPFVFSVPRLAGSSVGLNASLWPDGRTLSIGIPGAYAITIHDQVSFPSDPCDSRKGTFLMQGNPDAVDTWLHASTSATVSPTVILHVDGRIAVRWDVAFGPSCQSGAHLQTTGPGPVPAVAFGPSEHHRFYAIPTGSDTIVVITWAYGTTSLAAVNDAADSLVQSMTFR